MGQNYNNNEIFKKITSTLTAKELKHFTKILEVLRPTPELTGLNYTVTRLSECFQIAKKVRWPGDFNNQLEEQIQLIDKILANLDEVFIKINGVLHYLWRAVDQDGDEIDILVQKRKNKRAAMRFFKLLLKGQGMAPLKIVTDKLASYSAAKKELMPSVEHSTVQYEKNGCDQYYSNKAHQPTRQQERQMRGFKSHGQTQRFLCCHGVVNNLFRFGCHLMQAKHYHLFCISP